MDNFFPYVGHIEKNTIIGIDKKKEEMIFFNYN